MAKLFDAPLWLDRAVNVLLGGRFNETLSSVAHQMAVNHQPYWGWTAKAINVVFFWQPNHCKEQWEREQAHPLTGEMWSRDKLLHLGAGVAIALLSGFVLASPWMGFVVALVAGAVKELIDQFDPLNHTADLWDFGVTCLGGYVGTAFLLYV